MIKQSFTLSVTMLILSFLCPAFLNAQIVTDERMFSFEEPQLPACITGVQSQLGISGAHYKDGKHSLEWTFEPNGRLELRKDLKFEKKDPTGKDLYLSAFIVWIYNEQPQDAAIEFEFLKDGRKCASFPFGINFKGWRAAWVCYERDMQGTPEEGMNELRIVAPDAKDAFHRSSDHCDKGGCPPADSRSASPLCQCRHYQSLAGTLQTLPAETGHRTDSRKRQAAAGNETAGKAFP